MRIRAYTVGPLGNKHYGHIVDRWGDQVKFRLDGKKQAYWMPIAHVVVV